MSLLFACLTTTALAGSGPWVISEGDTSIYMGVESQRLEQLAQSSGAKADDVIDVDDGIETTGVKAVVTHGIREDIEVELDVSWLRAEANRPGGAVCGLLGPTTCNTTRGFAPVGLRAKWLVADELTGAPVSVAIGGLARLGQWTGPKRDRVTNLGEGTTDFGPTLAVGRSGGLGQGFWSARVDGAWLYRQSNVVASADPIPGSELTVDAEVLAGARGWWSLGPTLTWWERPDGIDVEDLLASPRLATDIDRFARLQARSVRMGGKLLVRSSERTTLVVSGWTTTVAVNNPIVRGVSAGLSVYPRPNTADGAN